MARPIWSGAIGFGLVNVPVDVYPADESHALSFAMLDKRDFAPVGYKRYNKKSGAEVPWESVVKGYEYEKGQYVVMTDEDFRRANVKASQTIEIEKSSGFRSLDIAARDAVRHWTFRAGTRNGITAALWARVPISFSLTPL